MPFKSLSSVIRHQIKQLEQPLNISYASPLSTQIGQQLPFLADFTQPTDVFRWGYSTWGIDVITTDLFPNDTP